VANGSDLIYTWKDEFSMDEKQKVKQWLQQTFDAVQTRIGNYPFDVYVFVYRRDNAAEPCPWANTWRYPNQQVHFHIDPTYPLQDFVKDWTAPHEFSHLAIPYIGEAEPWFSEGFASYLQYEVMEEMGTLTSAQKDSSWQSKVSDLSQFFPGKRSFAEEAMQNKKDHNYKAMYWGGACLFYRWNELLKQEGKTFLELFPEYLKCCRNEWGEVDKVVKHLDKVSGFTFGDELLKEFRTEPFKPLH
jgi:hypothetical protein